MPILMNKTEIASEMLQRIAGRIGEAAGKEAEKHFVGSLVITYSADGEFFITSALRDPNTAVGLLVRAAMVIHGTVPVYTSEKMAVTVDAKGN